MSVWHGIISIILLYLVSMDNFTMSWFFLPLIFEITNFFRVHNLVYLLLNFHVSNLADELSAHGVHISKYFAKVYVLSIFFLAFFFFKFYVFIEYLKEITVYFSLPIMFYQIVYSFSMNRRNKIDVLLIISLPIRFFIPFYFTFYKDNFMNTNTKQVHSWILLTFFILQSVLLILQYNFSFKQIFPCACTSNNTITNEYSYFKDNSFYSKNKIKIEELQCSICLNDFEKTNIEETKKEVSNQKFEKIDKVSSNVISIQSLDQTQENSEVRLDESIRVYEHSSCFNKFKNVFKIIVLCPYFAIKKICCFTKFVFKNYLCFCYFKNLSKKGKVMVTPCLHIFHTECLIAWLDQKDICPICRSKLPQKD